MNIYIWLALVFILLDNFQRGKSSAGDWFLRVFAASMIFCGTIGQSAKIDAIVRTAEMGLTFACLLKTIEKSQLQSSWLKSRMSYAVIVVLAIVSMISASIGKKRTVVLAQACTQCNKEPPEKRIESLTNSPSCRLDCEMDYERFGPFPEWPKSIDGRILKLEGVRYMEEGKNRPARKDMVVARALYSDGNGKYEFRFKINQKIRGQWVEVGGGSMLIVPIEGKRGYNISEKTLTNGIAVKLTEIPSRMIHGVDGHDYETDVKHKITITYNSCYVDFSLPGNI